MQVRKRQQLIKLSPHLYRNLDLIVRENAGTTIEVHDYKGMQAFAYVPMGAVGAPEVCIDPAINMLFDEMYLVVLANQIDVNRFWAADSWEMDWSKVPFDKVYHFLIWHEIHHLKADVLWCDIPRSWMALGDGRYQMFCAINEIRADRFAWHKICPDEAFPIHSRYVLKMAVFEQFMRENRKYFNEKLRDPRPIPMEADKVIPQKHIINGIPWADGVKGPKESDAVIAMREKMLRRAPYLFRNEVG